MNLDLNVDLGNLYPETWFGDAPGKKVCLRLCPPEQIETFRKECTKVRKQAVINTETRRMELADDSEFDDDRFRTLLHDYCIVDWDLKDVHGKPILCTDDNKHLLMQIPRFVQFITKCFEELNKAMGLRDEEEVKNSLAG